MPSAPLLKSLFALLVFVVTLAGGVYPLQRRRSIAQHDAHAPPFGETLATGVFLGAALLHMLPEADALFRQAGLHYPFAYIISGSVFLMFLWFEHLGVAWYHHQNKTQSAFAILALIMLSLHALMSGAALGLNQHETMMILIFLAIIAHKWAESFALATQLARSAFSHYWMWAAFLLFATMTPLGIFIGSYTGAQPDHNALWTAVLVAASAGTFLYLGTLHGLDRCVLVARCCHLKDFTFVILGFLLMALVGVIL